MGVNEAFAFQYLDKRLKFQVALGFDQGLLFVEVLPCFLIFAGIGERFTDHIFNAHARCGVARRASGIARARRRLDVAGAFRIFAEGELDAWCGAFEFQPFPILAPAHFHHLTLTANGVCRAMQDVGSGHSTGQGAIDSDVIGVDDVFDTDHCRHRH